MPVRIKFAYEVGPDGATPRPYLWLEVVGPREGREHIRGVLDTGADVSLLPEAYADLLGYRNDDLAEVVATSPGGTLSLRQAVQPVVVRLPGDDERTLSLQPLFAPVPEARWGRDFMSLYGVSIVERERQFSLFTP